MKTTINLQDYTFSGKNNPQFQISDDPITGFARVIEIDRAELLFDIDVISIKATTYFIDASRDIIVFKLPTLLDKKPWNIGKADLTLKVDNQLNYVQNPDYNVEEEVSPENYPYILVGAYDQFKEILINRVIDVLVKFVDGNDEKNLYD